MKPSMSKSAARRLAAENVNVSRFGRQWVVLGPWDIAKPDGPRTQSQPMDWPQALGTMRRIRVGMAAFHMYPDVSFFTREDAVHRANGDLDLAIKLIKAEAGLDRLRML